MPVDGSGYATADATGPRLVPQQPKNSVAATGYDYLHQIWYEDPEAAEWSKYTSVVKYGHSQLTSGSN